MLLTRFGLCFFDLLGGLRLGYFVLLVVVFWLLSLSACCFIVADLTCALDVVFDYCVLVVIW